MKDIEKVQSEKAMREKKNQMAMAAEAHNEIFGKLIGEQSLMAEEEPNWALYNYIMNVVDMRDCKTMQQALHKMYRNLWPHIKKYHNDRERLLRQDDVVVENYGLSPLEMSERTLNKVSEAARQRSRMNKYDIHIPKNKLEIVKE